MKIRKSTIERVAREQFCDVGKYRYILDVLPVGRAVIKRRLISELNCLPKYGPCWETVAQYDEDSGWTIID